MMCAAGLGLGLMACLMVPPARAASADVLLTDPQGKQHHFSEYIGCGQWAILVVWGPRCPSCMEEMPDLRGFYDDYHKDRAMVLGVAVNFPSFGQAKRAEVAKFADDRLISFTQLLGSADTFTRIGGADLQGVPTTLIYDPKSAIVVRYAGSVTRDMNERLIAKAKAGEGQ